eukprot:TRINITY_DN19991_c0_g2_i1.p1 TRINITY_DN19991_c0_g2~~TRINITY_DN19991_c0_g2_i1.p1  ORF type:complete len:881 (-),score=91.57 TRINITY_DN19991_c0_g2_i1:58-2700(-)
MSFLSYCLRCAVSYVCFAWLLDLRISCSATRAIAPRDNVYRSALAATRLKQKQVCDVPEKALTHASSLKACVASVKNAGGKYFGYTSEHLVDTSKSQFGRIASSRRSNCVMYFTRACREEQFVDSQLDYYDIVGVFPRDVRFCHVDLLSILIDRESSVLRKSEFDTFLALSIGSYEVDGAQCKDVYALECSQSLRVKKASSCLCDDCSIDWSHAETVAELKESDDTFTLAEVSSVPSTDAAPLQGSLTIKVLATTETIKEDLTSCSTPAARVVRGGLYLHTFVYDALYGGTALKPILDSFGTQKDASILNKKVMGTYAVSAYAMIQKDLTSSYYMTNVPDSIGVPTSMQYLNRVTFYNFIGTPESEIDISLDKSNKWPMKKAESCVYRALKNLKFDDGFTDHSNSWNKVFKKWSKARLFGLKVWRSSACPNNKKSCTKKEYMLGLFEQYRSKSRHRIYPVEVVNFRSLWYNEISGWHDEVERVIAFELLGAHKVEAIHGNDNSAHFVLRTNDIAALEMRTGFGRVGADMYFDRDGNPVYIRTPQPYSKRVNPTDRDWQYWKFVWRSSMFLRITLVDHLWFVHFTAANSLAAASRESLPATHPLRRLLTVFTYNTIKVNGKATHQLVGPNQMLHRATGFQDFYAVASAAESLLPSLTKIFEPFLNDTVYDALPNSIKHARYHLDGRLLYESISAFVHAFVGLYEGRWCRDGALVDPAILHFLDRIGAWSMIQEYAKEDNRMIRLIDYAANTYICDGLKRWLTVQLFAVTGYHRHVGTVGDYAIDPDFASFSWPEGMSHGAPRQHLVLALVSASTSRVSARLNQDFNHLVKDLGDDAVRVFNDFRRSLMEVEAQIQQRNARGRLHVPYMQMSPAEVESSVAV